MKKKSVSKKYIDFIDSLIEQVCDLIPADINKLQQGYLTSNMRHSCTLLAKSMEEDDVFKQLDFETQKFYIQIMAEWSFHKEIDLFRSGISPKYWKIVMQKIWYTTWEVMYACIQNNAPNDVVINLIERYITRTYNDALEELKNSNIIDQETENKAKEQSNIDLMAAEYRKKRLKRIFLLNFYKITLMLLISSIVAILILSFKIYGVILVLSTTVFYVIISHTKEE